MFAISQLAQTTLRSEVGKIDLNKTFEERTNINTAVVSEPDKASESWGVKVLRYEIKNITPHAVQLRVAERYITQFGEFAKEGNTIVLPANVADVGSMIAMAMKVIAHDSPDIRGDQLQSPAGAGSIRGVGQDDDDGDQDEARHAHHAGASDVS